MSACLSLCVLECTSAHAQQGEPHDSERADSHVIQQITGRMNAEAQSENASLSFSGVCGGCARIVSTLLSFSIAGEARR